MKICIFSDVHGNLEAFQQLLHREEGNVEYFIFAGDILGYFHGQREIIHQLAKMKKLYAVMGNHDLYYLLGRKNEAYRRQLVEKYGCSYNSVLSGTELAFLQRLPEYLELRLEDKSIGVFHGGLADHTEQRIYPDTVLGKEMYGTEYDYLILGHTHYQLFKKAGKTLIINPGSLGQPRDGKGFSYCILDTFDGRVSFKTVGPDIKGLLKTVKEKDFGTQNYEYLLRKYGN